MAGENYSFGVTPNPVEPGKAQAPFTARNLNPLGAQYASAYGYDVTDMIQKEMERQIFDAVPERLRTGIRMFMDRPIIDKNLDEFEWKERIYGRLPLKSSGIVNAGATQTIPLTAGGGKLVTINKVLTYPNGKKGIVYEVSGDTIKVKAPTGGTLPALAANDLLVVQTPLIGTGGNMAFHYDRPTFITRRNYIQLMERNKNWDRMELQKYMNAGTTNMLDYDKQLIMELVMEDIFVSLWNGEMGEFDITLPNGTVQSKAKTTQGIYPALVAAGAKHMTSTAVTFADDFADLAFATNNKSASSVRFLFATPELLFKLDKILKDPIRYTPADKAYDMNLMEYRIGEMRFVKVPLSVFGETGLFPADWSKRLFCLDMANINTCKVKGYGLIETGETPDKKGGTSMNDFKDYWMQVCIGLEYKDPMGSFYMDMQGV